MTVNGKKTKTYDVNGLTAVPVVKGENSIEFRYICTVKMGIYNDNDRWNIVYYIYAKNTL